MIWNDPVPGFSFFVTESEFVQLVQRSNREKKESMRNSDNPSGIYQIGAIRYFGLTPEKATDLQQLQKASPELFTGNYVKMHQRIKNLAAEASVSEAGGPEESLKEAEGKPGEAEGKQRDLIDSLEKLAKKKVKDEEAGKASVREAGNSEAYVTETRKGAEAVAAMNSAGGDSVISGEAAADMNSAGGDSVISEEAENDLVKMPGLRSKMQQDAEEPLQMEAKPKKKKTKTRKRREHVEDPIGSHQLGEMSYKGVTRQEAEKMYKEHMLRQDKVAMEEDRVRQYMLAGGRSLPDSQEQLANKNEKKNGKKNGKKNRKKAKAHANLKEEEDGKAEESVTQAGKAEESVAHSGKAEASATEAGKPEGSVTQSGKAEASVADEETDKEKSLVFEEETDEEKSPLFEDAEQFGARFQSFWGKCFGHRCAYHETTTIPAMRYTHGNDGGVCIRDTLQVVSVRVASIEEGLRWPLRVFGMVSIRDVVDRKRNIIFHRERDNCQTIAEKDPYLTLTGPSRAVVVCHDPSYIEVVLKVKGATESEDKELSRLATVYRHSCLINGLYTSELSTIKLRFSQVYDSVEATVHVKVTGGSWPDGFMGVFGAFTARTECAKVKLLSVGDDGLPVDAADGCMIRLSRRVVSVELRGMLKVFVSACPAVGGGGEERCEASFVPQKDGVSPGVELKIGSCRMEATVAWSLFCGIY